MVVAHVVIKHIRRRVKAAQCPVQGQRRGGEFLRHALRQDHLHDVAVQDVLLGAFDRGFKVGLTKFRAGHRFF